MPSARSARTVHPAARLLALLLLSFPAIAQVGDAAAPGPGATDSAALAADPEAGELGRELERLARLAQPATLARADLTTIDGWLEETTHLRGGLAARESRDKQARTEVDAERSALGPAADDTPTEADRRRQLTQRLETLDAALQRYAADLTLADDLLGRLQRAARAAAGRDLIERGDSAAGVLLGNLRRPGVWLEFTARLTTEGSGYRLLTAPTLALLAVLLTGCIAGGRWARRRVTSLAERYAGETYAERLTQAGLMTLAVHGPWLAGLGLVAGFMSWVAAGQDRQPYVVTVAWFALLWLGARTGLRLFLAPYPPARGLGDRPPALELRLARGLSVLALLVLLYWLLDFTADTFDLAPAAWSLLRLVFAAVLAVDVAWLVRLERRLTGQRHLPRQIACGLLWLALVGELLGYRNLARYLQEAVILTFLLGLAYGSARRLLDELFDRLDDGGFRWAAGLRRLLGTADGAAFPGTAPLRLTAGLMLQVAGALALLRIWALQAGYTAAVGWLNDGFALGSAVVVPAQALWGGVLLGLLLAVRAILREALARGLLLRSRLDQGARDAVVAIADYGLFALAVLSALRVVGPDLLRNLAVVAGALSVGIGFGLQNIVNNFVSGLILLFERQIKVGETISVGGVEGTVRRLSVRSTELLAADGSEIMVPNAELIQQKVTNRTRAQPARTLILRVPSPRAGDLGELRERLALTVRPHLDREPVVLLVALAAASAEFEVRVEPPAGADVDQLRGDLLLAIDAALRAAGADHGD